jgi:hypothetical protein
MCGGGMYETAWLELEAKPKLEFPSGLSLRVEDKL